jgi:penicillin-binding protein 1C
MKKWIILFFIIIISVFLGKTFYDIKPTYKIIYDIEKNIEKYQFFDKNEQPINITYQNKFNIYHQINIYDVKKKFIEILLFSEDKNFYSHNGVDWFARLKALYLNSKNFKVKMGASTISEQVIRIIYPRKRNLWSKWIEGIESRELEKHFDKKKILEFYINQIPFSNNIRGFELASKYYFNRSFSSLSLKEIIFLIINIRAPSNFDFYKNKNFSKVEKHIEILAKKLYENHIINDIEFKEIKNQKLLFKKNNLNIEANHFVNFIKKNLSLNDLISNKIVTTLDLNLQNYVNNLLNTSIQRFNRNGYNVKNGAALIIKKDNMDILSYNSISLNKKKDGEIDGVQILRQPASTLKPFLYSLALDKKLTLASKIEDRPISQYLNRGVHEFFNASRKFYGEVTVREALANSLNIPAIQTLNFVGIENFYSLLFQLGFKNLKYNYDYYNLGLAIGAFESNLLELIEAYGVLANNGIFQNVNFIRNKKNTEKLTNLSSESISLVSLVLSDKLSRRLEFSRDSILNLPMKVAVKTGTSNDFKDSWAIGYNGDYIIGVWLGNFNYESMNLMSGSIGPGLILRNIFNELYKYHDTSNNLNISNKIYKKNIGNKEEYFDLKNQKIESINISSNQNKQKRIIQPFNNMEILINPRIPLKSQKIKLIAENIEKDDLISWELDGKILKDNQLQLSYGKHSLLLKVVNSDGNITFNRISFICK